MSDCEASSGDEADDVSDGEWSNEEIMSGVAKAEKERDEYYAAKNAARLATIERQNAKVNAAHAELRRKQADPQRLHPDVWHNEPGELID